MHVLYYTCIFKYKNEFIHLKYLHFRKVKFGSLILLWKKLTPSEVTRLPPQLSLSSIVLRPPHAEIFSSSVDS